MASGTPVNRSIAVKSKPTAVVGVYRQVLSELEANDFSGEDIFAVHLALEEAFANAITHGNKIDPEKEVRIEYSVDLDRIKISMMDEGDGFDPNSVPDPRHGKNLYKTEGRGLLLMNSYMDVVEFSERGNCVRMVRYKEKPRLTGTQDQTQA
jgi:serine/threonine-protein kinase RsbW